MAAPNPIRTPLHLPPIDADVITNVPPWKVGHNHYEFIQAELNLTKVLGVCGDEVNAFDVAVGTFKSHRDQLNKLKVGLAQTPEKEQGSIGRRLKT